jgi:hypothetical protein
MLASGATLAQTALTLHYAHAENLRRAILAERKNGGNRAAPSRLTWSLVVRSFQQVSVEAASLEAAAQVALWCGDGPGFRELSAIALKRYDEKRSWWALLRSGGVIRTISSVE